MTDDEYENSISLTERYMKSIGAAWDPIPGIDEAEEDDLEEEDD